MTSAIVVGGAVGGLAAARALAACGVEVTVLERRPPGQAEGAGLLLYPPAAQALVRLDALDAFRARSVALTGIATYDQRGRVLNEFDATGFESKYGHPLAGVHRADLMAALAVEVRRGVEVTDVA
ncbi:MAG TPA: NAD(P)-binding protein, partial [Candidatus Dormibacteraeota bacterium]